MTRGELPPTRRAVSSALVTTLGGRTEVRAYYDDRRENVVAVVEAQGVPRESLNTSATASIHGSQNLLDAVNVPVELLMVGQLPTETLGNIVATSGFCVAKDRWLAAPGVVFPDVVAQYCPNSRLPHLIWTEPFDYPHLSTLSVSGVGDIHVLQGLPISEAEYRFVANMGYDALERRFEIDDVRYYDLDRPSVV